METERRQVATPLRFRVILVLKEFGTTYNWSTTSEEKNQ